MSRDALPHCMILYLIFLGNQLDEEDKKEEDKGREEKEKEDDGGHG